MRTLRGAAAALLLAVLSLVSITPARAQVTNQAILTKDGAAVLRSLCGSALTDGTIAPCHITIDTSGARIDPATKQLQQSILSQLGAGITVDLRSLNGAATDASVQAVKTVLGSTTDAKSTAPDTTPASAIALLKGQIDRLQAIITALGTPLQAGGSVNPLCTTVTGDQSWTVGNPYTFTCTTTGRLKVGLSSAATEGAVASTVPDLAGGIDPSGYQHGLRLDASLNLKASDANNASFTATGSGSAAESSATASYTFTNTAQRGFYANCPAKTVETITLTTAGGGQLPMTLYDGFQMQPIRVTGFSGNNTAGASGTGSCTIGALF